jgi:drug/metabolite transporter (DMT)-like permease
MTAGSPASRRDNRVEFLLLFVILIWAANYPVAKYGIGGLNIFVFNGIRFVVAAVVLAGVYFVRSPWTPVRRGDWPALLRAGVVANVIYQVGFIVGLNMTSAGNAAVLLATSPLWTVFLNARIQGERVKKEIWIGMSVSLVGIVMIIVGSGKRLELGGMGFVGDLICLGAAFFWAFNTNLQKPLLVRYSASQLSLIMVSIGAVGLSLIAVPPGLALTWGDVHWTYYCAAAVSGAASIGLGNLFWSHGVKRLGPSRTANFGNLMPVLAFIISYITLHEEVVLLQIVGAAVTLIGVWYARR